MSDSEPVHFRGIPRWAKVVIVLAALILGATSLGLAWKDASETTSNLSFGENDVEIVRSISELGHTGSGNDQNLVVHTLNTIVHLKAITNHQSLAGLAIAAGSAFWAIGFALFLLGSDGAFQIQFEGKGDSKLVFYATAPGLLCFVLGAALIGLGATRKQELRLGDFPASPPMTVRNQAHSAGEGEVKFTDGVFNAATIQGERTPVPILMAKVCIDRIIPFRKKFPFFETPSVSQSEPSVRHTIGGGAHIALLTGKKWKNGQKLRVSFLDGDVELREKVKKYAVIWTKYANIEFDFGTDPASEIRITFTQQGTWSYIGTDNLRIEKDKPTMSFGWLTNESSDLELKRTVMHAFGHALGAIHEYKAPMQPLKWNRLFINRFYSQPPIQWTEDDVEFNFFHKYSVDQLNSTRFDEKSIMAFAIPPEFTVDGSFTKWNDELSKGDIDFIRRMYPRPKE